MFEKNNRVILNNLGNRNSSFRKNKIKRGSTGTVVECSDFRYDWVIISFDIKPTLRFVTCNPIKFLKEIPHTRRIRVRE